MTIHSEGFENKFQSLQFAHVLCSWSIKIFPSASD